MRGGRKTKKVTWASDVNLRQVRLFLSEESPLQVGLGAQEHLQPKTSSVPHSNGAAVDDFLPPGFEGPHSANHVQINLSEIPVIKWRCPFRFVLDLNWQVVAGEESEEPEVQNQRELRVLEAVYPRPSAIPTNPSVSADIENCHYDDRQTLQIPITGIEDEDAAIETPSDVLPPFGPSVSSQPQLLPPGGFPHQHCSMPSDSNALNNEKPAAEVFQNVEPSVQAAASAAFTAINQSNEHGNMIDHDLLVRILSNPQLIEKLVSEHGAVSSAQNLPTATTSLVPPFDLPPPANLSGPSPAHISRTENGAASLAATSGGPFYPELNGVGVGPSSNQGAVPGVRPPTTGLPQKDANYYKNLIQQHGGERQEQGPAQMFNSRYNQQQYRPNQEVINNPKSRDSKPRIMKPCIYFNTSRGCRNGANCSFQHDASSQNRGNNVPDAPNAKRMKMDREMSSS